MAKALVDSNINPSRVKLNPDGIVEQYAVSPPPFVKPQTITINTSNTMNEFDHIVEKFSGVGGARVSSGTTPVNTRPVNYIAPPRPMSPQSSSVIAALGNISSTPVGGGGGIPKGEAGAGVSTGKGSFIDDIKAHALPYGLGVIGGAGVGYYVGNKYENGWIGAGIGAASIFGLLWLYSTQFSKPVAKAAPVETPAKS